MRVIFFVYFLAFFYSFMNVLWSIGQKQILNIIKPIMTQNTLRENKSLFLKQKSQLSLEQCFKRCTKSEKEGFKSISGRQQTCIQYCSIKFSNAYGYAFDLIVSRGIHRLPQSQLKGKTFK